VLFLNNYAPKRKLDPDVMAEKCSFRAGPTGVAIASWSLSSSQLKRDSLTHGFLVQSVKTTMQIPFDNFLADWKTDQIRLPWQRITPNAVCVLLRGFHRQRHFALLSTLNRKYDEIIACGNCTIKPHLV
jgi:hypothetical protein